MAIRKRNGKWYFDFMIRSVRYRSVIPTAKTKQDALKAEAEARQMVHEGRYKQQSIPSLFAEFADQVFLPWSKANKRNYETDKWIVRELSEFFGKYEFTQISPILIEKFKREIGERKTKSGRLYKPQTVNHFLILLGRIFEMAIDAGLVAINPVRRVKKRTCDNRRTKFLSREEVAALIAACTGKRAYLANIIRMAVNTGMRRGEILGLKWADVDLGTRTIYIRQSKTGKPRTIPINSELFEVLARVKATAEKNESVFFNARTKKPLRDIHESFKTACRLIGLNGVNFHDLRHTAPSWLAEAGVDAFTIANILGHASIQTSLRYTHASDARKREAVEILSRDCPKSLNRKTG